MEIIALGSGTSLGIPLIGCHCDVCTSNDPRDKRLRSSICIKLPSGNINIDVGPDFRQQLLNNQIDNIDAVLLTHEHNDHVIGIDELRALNFTQKKSIPLYGEQRVLDAIKSRFHYAFTDYPGVPKIELQKIETRPFKVCGEIIIPIRINHGRLPILGFRIKDFAYITDANHIESNELDKLKNLEVLIINALRQERHRSHFTLEECIDVINVIGPKRTFITHISHMMGKTEDWIKLLPENVVPLNDNMVIKV